MLETIGGTDIVSRDLEDNGNSRLLMCSCNQGLMSFTLTEPVDSRLSLDWSFSGDIRRYLLK